MQNVWEQNVHEHFRSTSSPYERTTTLIALVTCVACTGFPIFRPKTARIHPKGSCN